MQGLFEKVQDAASAIRATWDRSPQVGIILGTGLGSLVDAAKSPPPRRAPYPTPRTRLCWGSTDRASTTEMPKAPWSSQS